LARLSAWSAKSNIPGSTWARSLCFREISSEIIFTSRTWYPGYSKRYQGCPEGLSIYLYTGRRLLSPICKVI
jgi:hypothetical protein